MKSFAKFLVAITIVALLGTGYVIWASDARVSVEGYRVESAADRQDSFNGIMASARTGEEGIVVYDSEALGLAADQYSFVTYTIQMRNMDFVSFEWVEIELENQAGDVLLVKPTVHDIPAFNQSFLSFTLMVDRNTTNYERNATLTYYIYGHAKEIKLSLK